MIENKVISIILGGGQGSRLSPLTATRSKPAVPIAGKYRLVDIPISNCINSGLRRMFVLTQFNSASLNKHIKNTYNFSFFSNAFVDILAAEQTPGNTGWYQGTADAVRQSLHHLKQHDFEYILILSGDQLYQMDFREMIQNHIDKGAEITIATIPVNAKDGTSFGILKADENQSITSFTEKPNAEKIVGWESEVGEEMISQGRLYLASMGIYLFNKDVLIGMLEGNERHDFGKEIIPDAVGVNKIISYQYEGYWTDIGNIDSFFEANLGLTDDIPEFNLFSKSPVYSRSRMLPPSKISGTRLDKVIIADGCIINADEITHAVVGIRTRIGKGTKITNSYVMGSDYYQTIEEIEGLVKSHKPLTGIGENCMINNAILDKNCFIGNNVTINGGSHLVDADHETYTVKEGIVVVKKNAVINDGTVIG
ncbi:MAG: glucose-1-phosphate adenylyltransferase [Bacteroidetes bacterium]|nr:glucose-1-phosphate adenylyltransferase [Bacteroidota bacterium]MBU1373058.1 glucose-1-phosphate adenylyltransferase [Bacteroidota bacterium]MBU1484239.1 glucose-1-phosphate adenylyltransferase [Bacteroidota bacterium]MBU1761865.1 glucose-1-phosphate adenylyltransferase [Bacteroidota bacterium]MBU2268237.1 glucose-1-phosphate adenylyltransferase [Bacteroidota bacterium]